ncbi:3'5'-cyclic nucleotide phosphodiesterase, partial [Volvox carteri f. nagariensis]
WQFDTWGLQAATGGHALSALGFYIIQREGLIKAFRIQPVTLARLLRQVEAGYMDNPYHNAVHAADVLQTLHVIIHTAQLHIHYLDPLGLLAAYYAAIVHDYGHPGVTNDFLVAVSDPLAVRYNDRSPLENHHCAAAFELLQKPELDFLAPLTKAERTTFRKQAIDMVLATDMKQHFSILSHFNTLTVHQRCARTYVCMYVRMYVRMYVCTYVCAQSKRYIRRLGMYACMWLAALEEEFFLQGDRERALGLPISPLFDRAKQGVSKSQVGFYDFVALPLLHALTGAFPGTQQLMKCFVGNYNHWRQVEGQQP